MKAMKRIPWWGLVVVGSLVISGCASTRSDYDVPVVDGSPSAGRSFSSSNSAYSRSTPVASIDVPEGGHMVRKGDTLYNIASRYGLTPRELAAMNQLSDPNHISVGQILRVDRRASVLSRTVDVPAAISTPSWGGGHRSSGDGGSSLDEGGVEIQPLSSDSSGAKSLDSSEVGSDTRAGARPHKMPYSDEAWSALQKENEERARTRTGDAASKQPYSDEAWRKTQDGEKGKDVSDATDSEAEEVYDFLWPAQGRVLQGFSGTNKGVDIGGKAGQPVMASESGKVVYVGSGLRGYGKLIILKHNKQFLTAYAHNKEILVKEGQEVNRGQKIAEMGSTDSDQVKLHFEVRKLGKPVDPMKYLPER